MHILVVNNKLLYFKILTLTIKIKMKNFTEILPKR